MQLASAPARRPERATRKAERGTLWWALAGIVGAGLVIELCWLVLTPLSFRMTHGAEYTQTLLFEHSTLSGWLDGLLPLAVRLAPAIQQQSTYIDPQLNTLVGIFVLTSAAYLACVCLLDRVGSSGSRLAVVVVVLFALVFPLTLVPMPGLLTTDPFSYVMYGRISFIYRLNPYLVPPGAFPSDPLLGWIHPSWVMQPSVYGPLWTDLGWLMAKLGAGFSLVDQVFSYKLLANLAHLVNLGLVWWLLGRLLPAQRLTGFALYAWNPLVVFEFAGNAHNDVLMLTLLLLGLVPSAVSTRPAVRREALSAGSRAGRSGALVAEGAPSPAPFAWSAVLVWLSALVKFTSGLVSLFLLVAWLRTRPRVRSMAAVAVALLSLTLLVSWRWLEWPDALTPLVQAASGSFYGNSLVDLVGTSLGNRDLAKLLTRGLFLVYLAWEIRQVWRASDTVRAVLTASVRGLTAVLVLVLTWVLTWYFTWPLTLAVFLGWRTTLTRVVVALSLTCLPFIYLKHYWGDAMPDALALLYLAPLVGLALRRPSSRARTLPSAPPAVRQTGPAPQVPGPGV
jgi:hypothetical protein